MRDFPCFLNGGVFNESVHTLIIYMCIEDTDNGFSPLDILIYSLKERRYVDEYKWKSSRLHYRNLEVKFGDHGRSFLYY